MLAFMLVAVGVLCKSLLRLHLTLIQPPRALNSAARQVIEHREVEGHGLRLRRYDAVNADGTRLAVGAVSPSSGNIRGTVVLMHGHGSSKESDYWYAHRVFAHEGILSIFFDSRAHGESEGEYFTFGVKESGDLSAVIAESVKQWGTLGKVGVFAGSAGASVAICSLPYEPRISCAVISSAFASLEDSVARHELRGDFRPLPSFVVQWALRKAEVTAAFNVSDLNLVKRVAAIKIPVLLIYGEADAIAPPAAGKMLFEKWGSPHKELILVPGASHGHCFDPEHDDVHDAVRQFFVRQLIHEG